MTIDTQFAWLVVVGLLARLLDNGRGLRVGLLTISGVWALGLPIWLAMAVAHLGQSYQGIKTFLAAGGNSSAIANTELSMSRWQQVLAPIIYLSGIGANSILRRSAWFWLAGLLSLSIAASALLIWGRQAGQPMLAFSVGVLIASPFVVPVRQYLPESMALALALLLIAVAVFWRVMP